MKYPQFIILLGVILLSCSKVVAQKYKISGTYDYEVKGHCDCPENYMQGYLTYYYNNEKKLINICTPISSMPKGAHITIHGQYQTGKCDKNYLLFIGDFIDDTPLYTGVFENKTFKCPVSNEGKMSFTNGATLDVISSKPIPNGSKIKVTEASWGIKFCEGKYFQIYQVLNYENISENERQGSKSNQSEISFTGDFRSVKGTKDPASFVAYNVGYFTPVATKGNTRVGPFMATLDYMPNGEDIELSGYCLIKGYFSKIKNNEIFIITGFELY